MIRKECLTREHCDTIARQLKIRDKQLLYTMVHALYLVEQLANHGLQFTFKGGTCLSLIVDRLDRLSIDVDIEVHSNTSTKDVEDVIQSIVSERTPFVGVEQQIRRRSTEGSHHYRINYLNPDDTIGNNSSVILDVVRTGILNPCTEKRELKHVALSNEDEPTVIVTPTLEGLLGDKLTACAPLTVGVPIHSSTLSGTDRTVQKHQQMIKQLYDVNILISLANDWSVVRTAFERTLEVQSDVFGQTFTNEEVVMDLTDRALALFGQLDREYHPDLQQAHAGGHRSLSNYIIDRRRFDAAEVKMAALRAAHVGQCLLNGDTPITVFKDIKESELGSERIKTICRGLPKSVKQEAVALVEALMQG